ncbi:hypothetical protein TrLO_g2764 [Triparma laevis f. longispina]|uniref:Uncharacterized protein n=1 Tax=Triparma laevis f. longispina TaxID=1714387 RepID=A0A9W7FTX0_9STRA|nr:hypothetical protein TrLO_g2764 [Triparma laevis f. longispina]
MSDRPLQIGSKGAYIVRILMVGDSACGKTSLVLRFDQNCFSTKFVTTIGVDYRDKVVKVEGVDMRVQLWDTAGQERFRSLTSNFFGRADGFVLTYDITNRTSFENVMGWMRDINSRAPPDVEIILCANKTDVEDDERVVNREEGEALAEEFGVVYFECSAKNGDNVNDMFMNLATSIKHRRLTHNNQPSDSTVAGGERRENGDASSPGVFGFKLSPMQKHPSDDTGTSSEFTTSALDRCCG